MPSSYVVILWCPNIHAVGNQCIDAMLNWFNLVRLFSYGQIFYVHDLRLLLLSVDKSMMLSR